MLISPKIIALDTSTLGRVSRDYWSQDANSRDKAHSFIARLKHHGVFIAFTLHHVSELLRHENINVVLERLKFLKSLPMIAWLRPYSRDWFPGNISELISHELHSVVHDLAPNWQEIINKVRPQVWETGVGHEMFADSYSWLDQREYFKYHHEKEKYIASVDRTDPGQTRDIKINEMSNHRFRTKEEMKAYLPQFVQNMKRQLDCHGDRRLTSYSEIANTFANKTIESVGNIDITNGDIIKELLKSSGIPDEFVVPEMTMGELTELGLYANRLKMIAENLRPPVKLTMKDLPPNTLPSYFLERRLALIQRKAKRVSGSDMGDRHIAPLVFYADAIEVDKRTREYLNQVQRNEPELASLMGKYFISSDYNQIAKLI